MVQGIQKIATPVSAVRRVGQADAPQQPFNQVLQQAILEHPSFAVEQPNAQVAANQVAASGVVPNQQAQDMEEEGKNLVGTADEEGGTESVSKKSSNVLKDLLPEEPVDQKNRIGREAVPYQGPRADTVRNNQFSSPLAQVQQQKNQPNPPAILPADPNYTPQNVNQQGASYREVTPFQLFLDKAVEFFEMVSNVEEKSDAIMIDYIEGRASLEDLTLIKTKLGVALSFSVTLVNQVTQTFKEIQNMQV